jgi:hypothetical protein
MAKSLMWAVNGDQSSPKPAGVSSVYIVNGDTSIPRPAGVSEVYAVNGDTSIPKPAGVSSVFIDGVEGTVPSGVSVVNIVNYSSGPKPLPAKTLRFDFKYDHFNPLTGLIDRSDIGATWTHVADDVYDFHFDNPVWYCTSAMSSAPGGLFNIYSFNNTFPMSQHSYDIIDSNLSGVTDAHELFSSARKIVNCVLKNTGDIVNANSMLSGGNRPISLTTLSSLDLHSATTIASLMRTATSLISPLDITLSGAVTACDYAFYNCKKVPSGALALYESLSSQAIPPSAHSRCFYNCGSDTTTGAAELAQIPSDWK